MRIMRRRKRKISIFKILALILFLASLFMSYIIYKVNLLPNKYLYLVLGGIVFINIFFDIFLMRKKARKGVRGFFAFLTINIKIQLSGYVELIKYCMSESLRLIIL